MYIDIFLGIFLLIGLIQGYHRGIIRTVFAIAAIVVGLLAALKFSPIVVSLFEQVFDWDPLINLIMGLALTFILIMWGIKWLGRSAEKSLKLVKLNFINKFLGAVLFAGLMFVMYAGIIWFVERTELLTDEQRGQSVSYPYLAEVPKHAQSAFEAVKPVFRGFWEKLDAVLESEDGY